MIGGKLRPGYFLPESTAKLSDAFSLIIHEKSFGPFYLYNSFPETMIENISILKSKIKVYMSFSVLD